MGGIPKDLWFSLTPRRCAEAFAGMPQLFMIVSERGIEYGFAAAIHSSQFSRAVIKQRVREKAPYIFRAIPQSSSETVRELAVRLAQQGHWHFREKTRLTPNQDDFTSLEALMDFLHSDKGERWAAGSVSRYLLPDDFTSTTDLALAVTDMVKTFGPLMEATVSALSAPDEQRFKWTTFYKAIADGLLPFRNKRTALVDGIREISSRVDALGYLGDDRYGDGSRGFVRDICPFTTMGLFNRGMKESNRKVIAAELAKFLGVNEPVPETFDGIPILHNLKSWFFPWEADRTADHIDALWDVFGAAIKFADSDDPDDNARADFAKAFDNANGRPQVGWNLTMGLYWIRPWSFPSLDNNSQVYIGKKLQVPVGLHGPNRRCNSADYLAVMDTLEPRFQEASYPVHSYPELSLQAWLYKDPTGEATADESVPAADDDQDADDPAQEAVHPPAPIVAYTVEDLLKDGCFLERPEIERLLDRLRTKKNLILQGPPGTGKTWIAKRLAFALMGQKDESKVRAVQFHPNLSYEDFVRGWRPTGDGKLSLVDGVFMETIKAASKDSSSKFVVVIEEINRGNPAQIFGELLTLLEAGKRTPSEALELCYPDADGKRRPVHVPENLYVIGTMNIADRSLALVDLALRRRFAFVTLEPKLNGAWREWVVKECGIDPALVEDIERRIAQLNEQIADDLGNEFRIGHSYVTPPQRLESGNTKHWFRQVAETEIRPLLEEYWVGSRKRVNEAIDRLIQGW